MGLSELVTEETRDIRRLQAYGESLHRRRQERGITRIEIFRRTGVSMEEIAKAEMGELELSEEQKSRIAKFLRRQRIL